MKRMVFHLLQWRILFLKMCCPMYRPFDGDSRASFHIMPKKFCSCEGMEGNIILIRYNATCRLLRERSVRVRMHENVMCTIIGVRYVSGIRKSLMSLDS